MDNWWHGDPPRITCNDPDIEPRIPAPPYLGTVFGIGYTTPTRMAWTCSRWLGCNLLDLTDESYDATLDMWLRMTGPVEYYAANYFMPESMIQRITRCVDAVASRHLYRVAKLLGVRPVYADMSDARLRLLIAGELLLRVRKRVRPIKQRVLTEPIRSAGGPKREAG